MTPTLLYLQGLRCKDISAKIQDEKQETDLYLYCEVIGIAQYLSKNPRWRTHFCALSNVEDLLRDLVLKHGV